MLRKHNTGDRGSGGRQALIPIPTLTFPSGILGKERPDFFASEFSLKWKYAYIFIRILKIMQYTWYSARNQASINDNYYNNWSLS